MPECKIQTEIDLTGVIPHPYGADGFTTLGYKGGGRSTIPDGFFGNWRNATGVAGKFYIGRCSGFGVESSIRFSSPNESVTIGRYVSGGIETIFMCSGFHETRTISTCEFGSYDEHMQHAQQREFGQIIVKNDVWFGDSCLIMGGSIVENGCVIGARSLLPVNFRSEPYGIYVGSPARLKKFRFSEKVREALLDLTWWDMPLEWVKENNKSFLHDMTGEGTLEVIAELKDRKEAYVAL